MKSSTKSDSVPNIQPARPVFISFSHQDKVFAEKIYNELQTAGLATESMYYYPDEHQDTGDILPDKLNKALDLAGVFVMLLSNASIASSWCRLEYERFAGRMLSSDELRLVPVVLSSRIGNIPAIIRPHDYINYLNPEDFHAVVDKIVRHAKAEGLTMRHAYESMDPDILKAINQQWMREAVDEGNKAFMDRLDSTLRTVANQSSLLTPHTIQRWEESVKHSVWVVTSHLNNDLYDDQISLAVEENITRKNYIRYVYFVPRGKPEVVRRRKEFERKFSDYKHAFRFIEINQEVYFGEVVFYDPVPSYGVGLPNCYFQFSSRVDAGSQDAFIRIAPESAAMIVHHLTELYEGLDDEAFKEFRSDEIGAGERSTMEAGRASQKKTKGQAGTAKKNRHARKKANVSDRPRRRPNQNSLLKKRKTNADDEVSETLRPIFQAPEI